MSRRLARLLDALESDLLLADLQQRGARADSEAAVRGLWRTWRARTLDLTARSLAGDSAPSEIAPPPSSKETDR